MKIPISLTHACIKTLSAVEAEPNRSNQHELNGVVALQVIFGLQRQTINASFSMRGSDIVNRANVTWYDARENHPERSEFRLYFESNPVMQQAQEGDNIVIGWDNNGILHCELISQNIDENNFDNWIEYS